MNLYNIQYIVFFLLQIYFYDLRIYYDNNLVLRGSFFVLINCERFITRDLCNFYLSTIALVRAAESVRYNIPM